MTAALEGGEWSAAPPGKTRYPFYRRLGGPQDWSWRAENLIPNGIRSRNVQPVVSRYTDWATQPTHTHTYIYIYIYTHTHTYGKAKQCLCLTCSLTQFISVYIQVHYLPFVLKVLRIRVFYFTGVFYSIRRCATAYCAEPKFCLLLRRAE